MVQQVIYELGLKDKFSGDLNGPTAAVKSFESSLVSAAAKGIALFASFEFLKGSVEMFNDAEQASAQLNASMASTGNIANLNRAALDAQASALMETSLFDDDEITRAQSLLATFTNIRGEIFMQTIPAVTDLATKMGTDLKSAVLQVGKALQDTSGKGLTMLKKSGVDFSTSQLEVIKTLFATNRVAEAQALILKELKVEFEGSALAAAQAGTGPFTILQNQFANVREEIGGMIVALGLQLMPYLKKFVELIKDAVDWVKEHSAGIKALVKALGAAWLAFKVIAGAQVILAGISFALQAAATSAMGAAGGIGAMGAAMSISPIGMFAIAVGALTLAYQNLSVSIADAKKKKDDFNSGANADEAQYYAESFQDKQFAKDEDKIKFLDQRQAQLKKDIDEREYALSKIKNYQLGDRNVVDYVNEGGLTSDIKELFTGDNREEAQSGALVISNLKSRLKANEEAKKQLIRKKTNGSTEVVPGAKTPAAKTQASGAKAVTINVKINELTGIKEMKTTTIVESMAKVHDAVVQVMSSAINDFQIIAAGT